MAILPIITYNDPILRKKTKRVERNSEELQALIDDMFETMYHANGVGLAAPQIGRLLRIFVVNADAITEDSDEPDMGPMVFINPEILDKKGTPVKLEEGCLSIPQVRDEIKRPTDVIIRYLDRNFKEQETTFSGWLSRIIQHEYDHLEGVLFLDYMSSFRRRLHRSKLHQIDAGTMETDYPIQPKKVKKKV